MVQVMQSDEGFVRSVWEWVHKCDGSYRNYPQGTVLIQPTNSLWLEFDSWADAAAATRARLEEVRELREEIEWVGETIDEGDENEEVGTVAVFTRILRRLEAILAEKTAGMKGTQ